MRRGRAVRSSEIPSSSSVPVMSSSTIMSVLVILSSAVMSVAGARGPSNSYACKVIVDIGGSDHDGELF